MNFIRDMRYKILDEYGNSVTKLTQWDMNRIINIDGFEYDVAPTFYFCNTLSDIALRVDSQLNNEKVTVTIPNKLLTVDKCISVYLCLCDSNKNIINTIAKFTLPIVKRPKPSDYVYSDDAEIIKIEDLRSKIESELDSIQDLKAEISNKSDAVELLTQRIQESLVNGEFNGPPGTTDYVQLENLPSINGIELNGNISLTALKAQQALNDGKLKDIIVIRSYEEYDALFADEEKFASLTESMQEGDYILLVIIEVEFGNGTPATMLTTLSKVDGELVMNNGFASTVIDDKISEAVGNLQDWTQKKLEADKPVIHTGSEMAFALVHNIEYRRNFCTDLQLRLPQSIPNDYISSLVFNSGNKATTLSYPQTILFTGDDCIDNVFVPKANTTYNVMFWYDGINVNAVSRGVPYAQE